MNFLKKIYKSLEIGEMIFIFFLIISLLFVGSCMIIKDDNPLEEYIEDVILEKTGMDLDFSGQSPEVREAAPPL